MQASTAYISVGVNRSSSCATISAGGTLAFGAGKFVALWDAEGSKGVHPTLPGHGAHVTTVKLLREFKGKARYISGDAEGSVRIWQESENGKYDSLASIDAHTSSAISALGVPPSTSSGELDDHFFTGGSDGSVKLWSFDGKGVTEVQRMDLKGKLPLDIEVGYLPGSSAPIVVVGCTDRRIQIWTNSSGKFVRAINLEGHEDWVRCLSLTPYPSLRSATTSDLMLASGSQDNYIRLWRISLTTPVESGGQGGEDGLDILDEFEQQLAAEAGGSVQLSTKAHVLSVEDGTSTKQYSITLEALLIGHEAGITNLHWSPPSTPQYTSPALLTTSSDNSLMIWTPSTEDSIWVPEHRFGAVGGRGLGFSGAIWGKDGKSVMAAGWNGGWERWVWVEEEGRWDVKSGVTGHYGAVESVSWDARGEYLLSVSSDQTSRIHVPCAIPGASDQNTWAEIARPQIHGYDMADAAWVGSLRFVSGAEEKVTRVFDAPGGFVESLGGLGVSSSHSGSASSRPKGATVPPLGLSNKALGKAVDPTESGTRVSNPTHDSISQALTTIPTEEELATSTLWPEVEKVYGHGYELATLASSHDGSMIATACRATNAEHAVVRVVSTSTWDPIGESLAGHNLTVTRIAFSKDDKRILTCSRDRGWRIYSRDRDSGFKSLASDEKAHARMINDCCWSPDGTLFATASRDKTVKVWGAVNQEGSQWSVRSTIKLTEGVNSVDMIQAGESPSDLLLALGTETGSVEIYSVTQHDEVRAELSLKLDSSISHVGPVNRVSWRRMAEGRLQLASCSDDRSLRVFDITSP